MAVTTTTRDFWVKWEDRTILRKDLGELVNDLVQIIAKLEGELQQVKRDMPLQTPPEILAALGGGKAVNAQQYQLQKLREQG